MELRDKINMHSNNFRLPMQGILQKSSFLNRLSPKHPAHLPQDDIAITQCLTFKIYCKYCLNANN